ncbi:carbohydrate kinase [Ectothiorhodospiraceae bacterium BW-2]|nr:carbohydrate kinase [Ectothiorhodospiraceae bacterium BW-2]
MVRKRDTGQLQPLLFGEVLLDCFEDGSQVLGGAPFNVAWHLHAFGMLPLFVSRVGSDDNGTLIIEAMQDWGMESRYLQRDNRYPTGRVDVTITRSEPSYEIVHPAAWDFIEPPRLPANSYTHTLLYHGTLALRSNRSLQSLLYLTHKDPVCRFVDINVREPWWDQSLAETLLHHSDWVKLNEDELKLLSPLRHAKPLHAAKAFLDYFQLQGVIVTLGAAGAQALTAQGEEVSVTATEVEVIDAVGAGDAFASVAIMGLIEKWPLELTLQRGQEFASLIVGQQGATMADRQAYQALLQRWSAQPAK